MKTVIACAGLLLLGPSLRMADAAVLANPTAPVAGCFSGSGGCSGAGALDDADDTFTFSELAGTLVNVMISPVVYPSPTDRLTLDVTTAAGTFPVQFPEGAPTIVYDVTGPLSITISGRDPAGNRPTGRFTYTIAFLDENMSPLDVCPLDPADDADGDGICGNVDNCPTVANSSQADSDHDGVGDACEPDNDGDGIKDSADNCPLFANPDQADSDHDGAGDVCDGDNDNDGVLDAADQCLSTPAGALTNAKGCSIGELCPCSNPWKNHGAYVSCVAKTAEEFVQNGLMTEEEKSATVSSAAESACGRKK